MQYSSVNPATGVELRSFACHSDGEIDQALAAAESVWKSWRGMTAASRAAKFTSLAAVLEKQVESLARLVSEEMGKPVSQSLAEVRKCAAVCRCYAENCPGWLAPEPRPTDASRSFISYQPLGLILAIIPWNFPLFQFFRSAVTALIAGNCIVLKHAPNVPRIALKIVDLFAEAGFDPVPVVNLFLTNEQAGRVIADRRIRGVTITASCRAGRSVAEAAGRALKKTVLELGGIDPFIVFADADLEAAIDTAVTSRFANCGQVCISAKRFLVERPVFEKFTAQLIDRVSALRLGDPLKHCTDLGPVARADLLENLKSQLSRATAGGDSPVFGGDLPQLPGELAHGYFINPAVFVNPRPESPLLSEEVFGPVAAICRFSSEAEVLNAANGTSYGLGASVWTGDLKRIERLADELDFGGVFFNGMVKSDPRLPFGGTKDSGYGRDLAQEGAREFTNIKTVWIK